MWEWLTDKDWKTWIGHGLIAVLIMGAALGAGLEGRVGVFAVAIHFTLREVENAWEAKRLGIARDAKVIDGFWDWMVPVLVAIVIDALARTL